MRSKLLTWVLALLALPCLGQDTLLQNGYNSIAHESGGGWRRLLPGYQGGGMFLSRDFAFPAFDRETCTVMDKDAQPFASGIFDDASQAGAYNPFPIPPETYVDLWDAVMPNAQEQLLAGRYSPTIGAPMIPPAKTIGPTQLVSA